MSVPTFSDTQEHLLLDGTGPEATGKVPASLLFDDSGEWSEVQAPKAPETVLDVAELTEWLDRTPAGTTVPAASESKTDTGLSEFQIVRAVSDAIHKQFRSVIDPDAIENRYYKVHGKEAPPEVLEVDTSSPEYLAAKKFAELADKAMLARINSFGGKKEFRTEPGQVSPLTRAEADVALSAIRAELDALPKHAEDSKAIRTELEAGADYVARHTESDQ